MASNRELLVCENEDVITEKGKGLGGSWLLLQGLTYLEGDSAWLLNINRNYKGRSRTNKHSD